MTPLARNKFRSNIPPSDRQLWAIGMVVVQWSSLEQMIKAFAHAMTDADDSEDVDRKLFDATRAMQKRMDQWEALVKERMNAPWREHLLKITNEIKQVADQRDKIVHGAWSGKENAKSPSPEAHGPFSWGNPGTKFSWKLMYGDIVAVALRIEGLNGRLFEFALQASGKMGTGDDFTIGEAIRRILRSKQ